MSCTRATIEMAQKLRFGKGGYANKKSMLYWGGGGGEKPDLAEQGERAQLQLDLLVAVLLTLLPPAQVFDGHVYP